MPTFNGSAHKKSYMKHHEALKDNSVRVSGLENYIVTAEDDKKMPFPSINCMRMCAYRLGKGHSS